MPNERQLATLIWLGGIAVALLLYPKVRSGVRDISRAAVDLKIIIPVFTLLAYVSALVFVGWRVQWWTVDLITDTAFWFVGSALALLFNIGSVSKTDRFFRQTVLGVVGVTALSEFFVNDLFVFSFSTELVLIPLVSTLVIFSVFADDKPEFRPAKRLIDAVLATMGIALAAYIGFRLTSEWRVIDKGDALRTFALPVWLMFGVIPFIYIVSLYSNYEVAFKWVDFRADAERRRWQAKLALLLRLHLRTRDVGAFTMFWGREMASASSFREAWRVASEFQASLREDQHAAD